MIIIHFQTMEIYKPIKTKKMAVIIEKTNGQKERWFYLDEYAKINNCTIQTVYNKINNKELYVKLLFKKKTCKKQVKQDTNYFF